MSHRQETVFNTMHALWPQPPCPLLRHCRQPSASGSGDFSFCVHLHLNKDNTSSDRLFFSLLLSWAFGRTLGLHFGRGISVWEQWFRFGHSVFPISDPDFSFCVHLHLNKDNTSSDRLFFFFCALGSILGGDLVVRAVISIWAFKISSYGDLDDVHPSGLPPFFSGHFFAQEALTPF